MNASQLVSGAGRAFAPVGFRGTLLFRFVGAMMMLGGGSGFAAALEAPGVLTAYTPGNAVPVVTLFRGTFNQAGDIARVTFTNASPAEFNLSPGTHFTTLYSFFARPATLPAFNGQTLGIALAYAGRPDVFTEQWSADGTTIDFFSRPAGITQRFTAATAQGAADLYRNYFFSAQGQADFDRIQRTVFGLFNAVAAGANATDGAPRAATANAATGAFDQFGFAPLLHQLEPAAARPQFGGGAWRFTVHAENSRFRFDIPGGGRVKGENTRLAVPYAFAALRRWEVQGTATLQRTKIEGVKTWGPGVSLGLPFRLRELTPASPWRWVITPSSTFTYDWAKDGVTRTRGSNFVWTGGGTHLVEYRLRPELVLAAASQLTYHTTVSADLDFLPPGTDRINQWLLKNGVRARWTAHPRLITEALFIHSRFLRSAQVREFRTYGLGASTPVWRRHVIGLNVKIEEGRRYFGWDTGLTTYWTF
jgi:hypothetical protein